MPAYEYLCDSCDTRFEKRQKMSDEALEACPTCGGHVKRLLSGGAGAITRGSSQSSYAPPQCSLGGSCCGGQACMSDPSLCEQ